ncbi:MAG: hypothetical protein HY934_05380 [Candidatus Firestonebacteria bacterium]|nr:hypothetical protein [Candidatus Firestonebacteria bacterium]
MERKGKIVIKYFIFNKKINLLNILIFIFAFSACHRKIVHVRKYPDKYYEIIPIDASGNFVVDRENNSITAEIKNIKIKVKYVDFNFLFNNFSYLVDKNDFGYTSVYRLVPFYIAKRVNGKSDIENYFSQFTVFYVYIENKSDSPIMFNQKRCVMVDGMGNQYSTLDEGFLKSNQLLYGYMEESPFFGIKRTLNPLTKILGEVTEIANAAASITPYGGMVKIKGQDNYNENKRYDYKYPMDIKLFLQGGEIFPSVNYSGFMVFRKISDKSFTSKLIFPYIGYKYTADGRVIESINFEFNFSKVMNPKAAYFDSSSQMLFYISHNENLFDSSNIMKEPPAK